MKIIRSIILAIFIACALFLGVTLIWAFLSEKGLIGMPFDIEGTVKVLVSSPWNWRAGLSLLAVGAVLILLRMRELRREQCIAFDNPGGEVAISMDAVEDFIKKIGNEFPKLKSLVPRIHAGPEGIGIAVRMDLWAGASVPRISEELQNAVKSRVQDALGINVSYVSVSVGKIVGGEEVAGEDEE